MSRASRGRVKPFGRTERAGRLARALLGLPERGHRLGQRGQPDDQRDLAQPVHVVSQRLGHATPMVTLTIYAHVMPGSQRETADTFARLVREARGA